MAKRKTGWPFQEGFLNDGTQKIHLFTDYRWNDGSVSRRFDASLAIVRPFSLTPSDSSDQ